jgi:D5 N terminal like
MKPIKVLPRCTDTGNAEFLTLQYGEQLRFDHLRGRWLLWRNHCWKEDEDCEVMRLAKEAAGHRLRRASCLEDDGAREKQIRWALESESRNG